MSIDISSYSRAGQVFSAANVAAKSVIAVTAAMTGVILYNPIGSGKKLVVVHAGFAWTTAPAAVHNIGLALMATNATVPTTLTAIGSGVVATDGSGNAGVAKAWDAATLPAAPVAIRWFGGAAFSTGASIGPYSIADFVDGAIAVIPGAAVCLTVVTTTAVGLGSITWAEVPV